MTSFSVRAGRRAATALLIMCLLVATGCKDATLGPTGEGSIEGEVLHFETGEALAGASITTSPPSQALATDSNGRFELDELEAGNYQITARKSGFQSTTVSVSVRQSRTSSATIFLDPLDEDEEEVDPEGDMTVEILSFRDVVREDSSYVETEYRVRNVGTVSIEAYDVYFVIRTGSQDYFFEVNGSRLLPTQSDIRTFERPLPTPPTTGVEVDTLWFTTESQSGN